MKKFSTKIVFAVAMVAASLGLASCAKDDGKTLFLYNWTYYTPEDVVAQFEEEFGVVNDNITPPAYKSDYETHKPTELKAENVEVLEELKDE